MNLTELEDAVLNGGDYLVLENSSNGASAEIVDIVERKNEIIVFRANWDKDDGGMERPTVITIKGRVNKIAPNVWTISNNKIRPANEDENDSVLTISRYEKEGADRHKKALEFVKSI